MHPAIRSQVNPWPSTQTEVEPYASIIDNWPLSTLENSEANGRDVKLEAAARGENPDPVRQEEKDSTDINLLLGRNNPMVQSRTPVYGEINFGVDLQTALYARDAAERMVTKLPPEILAKYPTWHHVLEGLNTGQLEKDLNAHADKNKAAAVVAAARDAGEAPPEPKSGSRRAGQKKPDSPDESGEPSA